MNPQEFIDKHFPRTIGGFVKEWNEDIYQNVLSAMEHFADIKVKEYKKKLKQPK